MSTYSLGSSAVRRADYGQPPSASLMDLRARQEPVPRRIDSRLDNGRQRSSAPALRLLDFRADDGNGHAVDVIPDGIVSRRATAWDGVRVEVVESVTHAKVEFRSRGRCHLLLVYEDAVRDDGETLISGLGRSTLRTLTRRLTFVPAGHEFREWQRPRGRTRVICFYLDPVRMPVHAAPGATPGRLRPNLLFENGVLWETAVKLAKAIEGGSDDGGYAEALSAVVAYEIMRIDVDVPRKALPARGGLAVWQQRKVAAYIEEHIAELIPLATLAQLLHLSSYHFCRAFKRSFGIPPHRYHINLRIERAKALLADPEQSVTNVAIALGFSETGSFSTAFRQATGISPSEYRRTL